MNTKILLALSLASNIILAGGVFYCVEQLERISMLAMAPPTWFTSVRIVTNAPPAVSVEPAVLKTVESIAPNS